VGDQTSKHVPSGDHLPVAGLIIYFGLFSCRYTTRYNETMSRVQAVYYRSAMYKVFSFFCIMSTPIITSTGDAFVPRRRRLPDERKAVTHKFQIGLCEGYITVGL